MDVELIHGAEIGFSRTRMNDVYRADVNACGIFHIYAGLGDYVGHTVSFVRPPDEVFAIPPYAFRHIADDDLCHRAKDLAQKLRTQGIFIRNADGPPSHHYESFAMRTSQIARDQLPYSAEPGR